jgi:hypothetical protein
LRAIVLERTGPSTASGLANADPLPDLELITNGIRDKCGSNPRQ